MNEIERLKSIDVNGAIKKALVEQEKSKSLDEIERAIKFLGHVKGYDIQSANLAIEALREQAERSKGCEYCLQGEDLAYGHDSMQRTGRIYIDGNLLTADLYSESMAVAVCCCPLCGKRLEVEP